MLVDIHGSCVSRTIFNYPANETVKVKRYFARNNHASSMMPPADISTKREELLIHDSEYSHRCMRQAIEKQAVPSLMESESEFLVIDFFDFCQPVACYKDTTFSTYDYCFYNTSAFRNERQAYSSFNYFDVPSCLWYGYIDLYFQKMTRKYGNQNIVLNKLSCFNGYIDKFGNLQPTPEKLLNFGNAKFNKNMDDLETYVIERYHPYVIDITKYFVPDEHHNPDVTPIHYEESYQEAGWFHTCNILMNKPTQRVFDHLPPKVISSLLNRQVNDADFIRIYNARSKPYLCHDLLDDILADLSTDDIAANRRWLAELFEVLDQEIASALDYHDQDALLNFLAAAEKLKTSNEYQRKAVELLRGKKEYLSLSDHELIKQFNRAVDTADSKWAVILKCMGIRYPEDTSIMNMLLNYYTAVNDAAKMTQIKHRLEGVH